MHTIFILNLLSSTIVLVLVAAGLAWDAHASRNHNEQLGRSPRSRRTSLTSYAALAQPVWVRA